MAETPTTAGSTANRVVNKVFENVPTRVLQEDIMMPSRKQTEHTHKRQEVHQKKKKRFVFTLRLIGTTCQENKKTKIKINQNIDFTEYTIFSPVTC